MSDQGAGGDQGARSARGAEDYIIEFRRVGNAVKVSAVDPRTGIEVSIVGPTTAGHAILSRNAIAKLRYVLDKKG